ncbi:hypothetical protein [Nostoc sp.]
MNIRRALAVNCSALVFHLAKLPRDREQTFNYSSFHVFEPHVS